MFYMFFHNIIHKLLIGNKYFWNKTTYYIDKMIPTLVSCATECNL